jgi:hypothetical protein
MTRTVPVGRLSLLAALAVLVFAVPAAHAGPRFFIQIGAPIPVAPVVMVPRVIPPPPAYGLIWRSGYYDWTGYGYAWVPGVWVRPPYARAAWVGPRWVRQPRGVYWARGYWRR